MSVVTIVIVCRLHGRRMGATKVDVVEYPGVGRMLLPQVGPEQERVFIGNDVPGAPRVPGWTGLVGASKPGVDRPLSVDEVLQQGVFNAYCVSCAGTTGPRHEEIRKGRLVTLVEESGEWSGTPWASARVVVRV